MAAYNQLIAGYREFRKDYLGEENREWLKIAKVRQTPKVMMIACSDSRVNPAIITRCGLGEIFMVNNVANLVPPFEEDKEGKATYHGTSAAIEFGVNHLQVGHIIIMGHSECGGIRSLMDDSITKKTKGYSFIKPWMDIVQEAKDFSRNEKNIFGKTDRTMVCEKRAVLVSLNNLATFPWVKEAVTSGTLKLHGWYYQINNGCLSEYNVQTDAFEEII